MMLRQSATYFVANVVSSVMGLLSVVAFTRLLTPAEYGIFVLGLGVATVFNAVLFTWLRMAIVRFQSEGDTRDLRRTVLVAYCLTASTLPVAFLVMLAVAGMTPRSAGVLFAFVVAVSLFEAGQEILRARMLAQRYAISAIARSTLGFVLGLIAVSITGAGMALLAAIAVSYFAAVLLVGYTSWAGAKTPFDRAALRDMAMFGGPLTLLGLTASLHAGLDRFVLAWLFDTEVAGRFAAATDMARQCVITPCAGVFAAILPLAIRTVATGTAEEAQRVLAQSAELIAAVVLPTATGLALVSGHLSQVVFGPEFRATAAEVLPIVAFASAASLYWQQYFHMSFHLAKKPHLTIIQCTLTLCCGFVLMVAASSIAGMRGAALALLGTEIVGLVISLHMTRYAYRLPIPWDRLQRVALAVLTMAVATVAIERLVTGPSLFELVLMVVTGAVSYALACVYFDVGDARAKLRGRDLPSLEALPSWLRPPCTRRVS